MLVQLPRSWCQCPLAHCTATPWRTRLVVTQPSPGRAHLALPQDSWSDCVSSKTGRAGLGRAGCWCIVDIPPPHHRSAQPVRQGTCLSRDAGRESSCICFCSSPGQRGPLALFSRAKRSSPTRAAPHEGGPRPGACVSCVVLRWSPKSQDAWPAMLGYRYPPPADQGGRPGRCKLAMAEPFPFHRMGHGMCPRSSRRAGKTHLQPIPLSSIVQSFLLPCSLIIPSSSKLGISVSNRCRPRPRPPHHYYPYPRRRTFLSPSRIVRQSRGHPAHPAPSQRHLEIRSLRQTPSCTTQWPNAL